MPLPASHTARADSRTVARRSTSASAPAAAISRRHALRRMLRTYASTAAPRLAHSLSAASVPGTSFAPLHSPCASCESVTALGGTTAVTRASHTAFTRPSPAGPCCTAPRAKLYWRMLNLAAVPASTAASYSDHAASDAASVRASLQSARI